MGLIRRMVPGVVISALSVLPAGCSSLRWCASYAEGEQERTRDRQSGRPERDLLLFYKDHLDTKSGRMQDVLASPEVRPLITDKIRCVLVTDYALNGRYMAQYGVDSAPALVVVHPDGTYHARSGALTVEQTRDFLSAAVGTGAARRTDVQILPVPDYDWHNWYEEALELAARKNRPLLIVFKWWLSADSTVLISRLGRPRVRRQFADMVHCRLDWDYRPNRAHAGSYGVSTVPSMIIVRTDGTFRTLLGLPSVDQIIRFAVESRAPERRGRASVRRSDEPVIRWYYSFDRAQTAAEQQGRNLFLFYHSVFAEASNRSARLFDTPPAAALLSKAVCCRLDWVVLKNRDIAARFGLSEPPGYVVVPTDGAHTTRSGPLTLDELSELFSEADRTAESASE